MLRFLPFILLLSACGQRTAEGSGTTTGAEQAAISDLIEVTSPRINEQVTSPLTVSGRARGSWYFEADFPLKLVDGNGHTLARGYASAEGAWMTEDFVPFTGTLDFSGSDPDSGYLILQRANPSGLAKYADSLRIPVNFRPVP